MNGSMARQQFFSEIRQPEDEINLARAALYLAQEEYADLDPDEYLNAMDTMAAEVEERLPRERYPLKVVQTINAYLYDDLGFAGNYQDYYSPQNSYLNRVIDRRLGIPITLSLVYLEIARRVDFPMSGVGMPGHFLIRPDVNEMHLFVDPFNRGEVMFEQDCQERLNQIYGGNLELQPQFLQPIGAHNFLARMLNNLKMIYISQNDVERALAAIDRILLIFPDAVTELRDRGLAHYQLEQWAEAQRDLDAYLQAAPNATDADLIINLLAQLQSM